MDSTRHIWLLVALACDDVFELGYMHWQGSVFFSLHMYWTFLLHWLLMFFNRSKILSHAFHFGWLSILKCICRAFQKCLNWMFPWLWKLHAIVSITQSTEHETFLLMMLVNLIRLNYLYYFVMTTSCKNLIKNEKAWMLLLMFFQCHSIYLNLIFQSSDSLISLPSNNVDAISLFFPAWQLHITCFLHLCS